MEYEMVRLSQNQMADLLHAQARTSPLEHTQDG